MIGLIDLTLGREIGQVVMPTLEGAERRKEPTDVQARLAASATAIIAAAIAPSASSASPSTATVGRRKPTIVLVDGAWADSSDWKAEVSALTRLGYPVVTIANPLRGLTADADYARARLQTISGPLSS